MFCSGKKYFQNDFMVRNRTAKCPGNQTKSAMKENVSPNHYRRIRTVKCSAGKKIFTKRLHGDERDSEMPSRSNQISYERKYVSKKIIQE